jgi:hypothetical protein
MSRRRANPLMLTPIEDRVLPAAMGAFASLPPMEGFLALASHAAHPPAVMSVFAALSGERFAERVPLRVFEWPSVANDMSTLPDVTMFSDATMAAADVSHAFHGRPDFTEDFHRLPELAIERTAVYMPQSEPAPIEESSSNARSAPAGASREVFNGHSLLLKENGPPTPEAIARRVQSTPVGPGDAEFATQPSENDTPAVETPIPAPASEVASDPTPVEPEAAKTSTADAVVNALASFAADPIAGLLPFEAASFQAATESLLDHLADLGDEMPEGLGQPEVLASIGTAAVFLGGASYLAFFAPPRRRLADNAPGSKTSLVWRDSQRDEPTKR